MTRWKQDAQKGIRCHGAQISLAIELCHGVDDGDDKVDYHGQKEVAKHPGEFAGFLIKREERRGHMVLCLIPRSDAVGLGTSLTKMFVAVTLSCVCVCV